MAGFIILNRAESCGPIARSEQKMGGLLRKGRFAQTFVTSQNPGMVKHVFGKGLAEYLLWSVVAQIRRHRIISSSRSDSP